MEAVQHRRPRTYHGCRVVGLMLCLHAFISFHFTESREASHARLHTGWDIAQDHAGN